MWRLLCRVCHANVYLNDLTVGDNFRCLPNILWNSDRTSNIIGGSEWKYAQREPTFRDMGNNSADQAVSSSGHNDINTLLSPRRSLEGVAVQVGNRDNGSNIDAKLTQMSNRLWQLG